MIIFIYLHESVSFQDFKKKTQQQTGSLYLELLLLEFFSISNVVPLLHQHFLVISLPLLMHPAASWSRSRSELLVPPSRSFTDVDGPMCCVVTRLFSAGRGCARSSLIPAIHAHRGHIVMCEVETQRRVLRWPVWSSRFGNMPRWVSTNRWPEGTKNIKHFLWPIVQCRHL